MRILSKLVLSDKAEENLKQLYMGKGYVQQVRIYKKNKIRLLSAVILIFSVISVMLYIEERKAVKEPIDQIERNGYEQGDKSVTVWVTGDSKDCICEKRTILVKEKQYSDDELIELSNRLDEVLWQIILGENDSVDAVTQNLNLVSKVEGFPFDISWKSGNPLILSSKGIIDNDTLSEESEDGVNISLTAVITYGRYREEKEGMLRVFSKEIPEEEDFMKVLDESIHEMDVMSQSMDNQILPTEICGRKVYFYKASDHKGIVIFVAGIIVAVLSALSMDKKIEEKMQVKKEQMRRDYPEILNKFALYHTAGMNPRSIWNLLSTSYARSSKKRKRYIYEEMLITNRSMQEGQGELSAYDDFAARVALPEYKVFVNLLQQAVTKGRDDFDRVLYEEMDKAEKQESLKVRITGEEAGTKLLIPMFMMLMIVLVIVMVPAFMSFKS